MTYSERKLTSSSHQMKALAMMVEKECGVIEGARFGVLWEILQSEDGVSKLFSLFSYSLLLPSSNISQCPTNQFRVHRYRHVVTGRVENRAPSPVLGGILGDVSLLSLIKGSDLTKSRKWDWANP